MVVSIRAKIEDEWSQYCACSGGERSNAISFEIESSELSPVFAAGHFSHSSNPSSITFAVLFASWTGLAFLTTPSLPLATRAHEADTIQPCVLLCCTNKTRCFAPLVSPAQIQEGANQGPYHDDSNAGSETVRPGDLLASFEVHRRCCFRGYQ